MVVEYNRGEEMKYIPLTNSEKQVIVDDQDYEPAMKYHWFLATDGHVVRVEEPQIRLANFVVGRAMAKHGRN